MLVGIELLNCSMNFLRSLLYLAGLIASCHALLRVFSIWSDILASCFTWSSGFIFSRCLSFHTFLNFLVFTWSILLGYCFIFLDWFQIFFLFYYKGNIVCKYIYKFSRLWVSAYCILSGIFWICFDFIYLFYLSCL